MTLGVVLGRHGLGEFERHVLLAIGHQGGQAYAVSIIDEIHRRTGKRVSLGAVYATVDRLAKKGFVSSELGEPTPERGGKRKRFYRIEARGERALSQTRELDQQMWAPAIVGALI
jgi:PadR family transcriptional regulator, regulatory protein PadR